MVAAMALFGNPLSAVVGAVVNLPWFLGRENLWYYALLLPIVPGKKAFS